MDSSLNAFEVRLVRLETIIAEREAAQEERAKVATERMRSLEELIHKLLLLGVGQLLAMLAAGAIMAFKV